MDQSVSQVAEVSESEMTAEQLAAEAVSDQAGDGFWEFDQVGEDDVDKPTVYPPDGATGAEQVLCVLNKIGTWDGLEVQFNDQGGCRVVFHGHGPGTREPVHTLVRALGLGSAPRFLQNFEVTQDAPRPFQIVSWNPDSRFGTWVQVSWFRDPFPPF